MTASSVDQSPAPDRDEPLSPLLPLANSKGQLDQLRAEGGSAFVSTGMRPFVLAALAAADRDTPLLVIAGDDAAARRLADDLRAWLKPRPVLLYPTRGIAGGSHLAPPSHLIGLRLGALDALAGSDFADGAPVVVASAVALAEKVPEAELRPHGFSVIKGDRFRMSEMLPKLVDCGYERVEQVTERGQFSVRGDIIDIYPATAEHAVRIDLWDEDIESLRWFSTFTQRSLGVADEVFLAPAAELRLDLREAAEYAALEDPDDRLPLADLLPLARYVAPLDLIDSASIVIAASEEIKPSLDDWWLDVEATLGEADAAALNSTPAEVEEALSRRSVASLSIHDSGQEIAWRGGTPAIAARTLKDAEPDLERLTRDGYRVAVAFPWRGDADRAALNLVRMAAVPLGDEAPEDGSLVFTAARITEGFVCSDLALAVIPADRLVRRRVRSREPRHGRAALKSFTDLKAGDTVVHEDHGVARFTGFDTKTVAGVTRDYLQLEFLGGDKVFMPVDQLAKITRHLGSGSEEPGLSKLGGNAWERIKNKARAAADRLAGELLNLYAERRRRRGHAFAPDGEEQRDFEASFPHRETPDQLEAIEQVKADMESPEPMDRLICGDVGYGKTEVALRAAFKCALEGRQVLVLVPTTILAQQHFGTFAERFSAHPLIVDHVSRFRSAAEQKEVVAAFNAGKVDVLVGTHRVLGRDIQPKDLGLIIVDEEQRFGVKQKELLRQLKLRTDVMAMSATPIPRTLQMSLAGVRDISVIETPPEGRRPVRTYVGEFDEELLRTALQRELDRKGKAFYLHNRIETIEATAQQISSLVPKARVEIAHGALEEGDLEERMLRFVRGEADVLVCTSIIEAGLDIPEANTLIVERADTLGLSQLYQIRGRVGRGTERANAYLFYPSAAALTHDAAQRLAALSDHTELGSGFRIAMRDLEIRGAGNLLGPEQSGHVAALGFELYMKLLDEAVAEMEGSSENELQSVRVDVQIDAWVPEEYVKYERAKIDIHRRVASAVDVAELEDLRSELEDRFGPVPDPVDRLLGMQRAQVRLRMAGARDASYRQGKLTIGGLDLLPEAAKELRDRIPVAAWKSGAGTVTVPVEDEPQSRYEALVHVADTLAAVTAGAAA
ncbi:MAG: transcription-repair coupling factor [Solirubrobacterales bacterium]|nr:transcription-repair coupling factor [Solirubrobacterales bacterium]